MLSRRLQISAHDECLMAVAKRSIKTVGLVVKRDRPEAIAIARTLTRFLQSKRKLPLADSETAGENRRRARRTASPRRSRRPDRRARRRRHAARRGAAGRVAAAFRSSA